MQGRIVLVTGAASGIGAQVARQAAAAGARVAVCDVDAESGRALAQELGGAFFRCDVADLQSMTTAVAACSEKLGVPDFAHLNAGVMTVARDQPFLAIEAVSEAQYRRIRGVNLDGVFHGLKILLPLLRQRSGAITVTASIAGLIPLSFDPLYSMTKHAVIGLVRSVAEANEGMGVRINAICPGGVDTAIVPEVLRSGSMGMMPPAVLAAEVIDLLRSGANGEIRVKASAAADAFAIAVPNLSGSAGAAS